MTKAANRAKKPKPATLTRATSAATPVAVAEAAAAAPEAVALPDEPIEVTKTVNVLMVVATGPDADEPATPLVAMGAPMPTPMPTVETTLLRSMQSCRHTA